MAYRITAIELLVRETKPARAVFSLGKKGGGGDARKKLISPLAHVRMVVKATGGKETFGCSADRLSVRWLDKRPGRSHDGKRRELVSLVETAREVYLKHSEFDSPFDQWRKCHPLIMKAGRAAKQEDLSSSFASALMERAMLDAVCRLDGKPLFQMLKADRLGFQPGAVHKELEKLKFPHVLPTRPNTELFIRHTVGSSDPLTTAEVPKDKRIGDGLPESLQEYVKVDGIRHFKIKITGDPKADLKRMAAVWEVVQAAETPVITLDANESYRDLKSFAAFVDSFEKDQVGAFQHVEYIEQPLPRSLTIGKEERAWLKKIAAKKPLLIDEADGTLDAYKLALADGYQGTSHKNCKGFFKSLLNYGLVVHHASKGKDVFLSAEDLQNLPIVPLHQDFVSVGLLGLNHCERNGHHYNYGLSMLSEKDKASVAKHHTDLYEKRKGEWFLRIRGGKVRCASLQCPGFGVRDEPDWKSMTAIRRWVRKRHPE